MRLFFPHYLTAPLLAGAVFAFDRYWKWLAYTGIQKNVYIVKPWLGFEFFANPGAAFGFPFPSLVALVVTPFLFLLFFLWVRKNILFPWSFYGLTLFFAGALSNYIDRVLYEITIDYIRILTGIINLADLAVVAGIVIVFLCPKRITEEQKEV